MSSNLNEVLAERGGNYGDFAKQADLSQAIKQTVFRHLDNHNPTGAQMFQPMMAESLEMIIHKIARIANGNPMHEDSWRDIAGYATLVADAIPGGFPRFSLAPAEQTGVDAPAKAQVTSEGPSLSLDEAIARDDITRL